MTGIEASWNELRAMVVAYDRCHHRRPQDSRLSPEMEELVEQAENDNPRSWACAGNAERLRHEQRAPPVHAVDQHASGETELARATLGTALQQLKSYAEGILDPTLRDSYLTCVPQNILIQELAVKWQAL